MLVSIIPPYHPLFPPPLCTHGYAHLVSLGEFEPQPLKVRDNNIIETIILA